MSQKLDEYNFPHPGAPVHPDPRAFLDYCPANKHGPVANMFHFAVRDGAQTPQAVCDAVSQTVQRRLEWSSDLTTRQFLQSVLDLLQAHKGEALAYAASVLAYEKLPYAERQQIKGRRALAFVMQDKPTTEKQAALIRSKGYTGPIPPDRSQASFLIDRLLRQEGGAQ